MGKLGLSTVKYIIYLNLEVNAVVDKSDVIGAIFGQTEGLLGRDLELSNLQRSGRIGRIDVEIITNNGKSYGKIKIPTSLDKVETAIIASALETVDKIGPASAKIVVEKIEDVRLSKRLYIKERAKELLEKIINDVLPDSNELIKEIEESLRIFELKEIGDEKIAAGPDLDNNEEMILVEGKADVINLLKAGIRNVISTNGTTIPDFIINLTKRKTTIVFLDGDRGGDLILRALLERGAEIDFVVRAPAGKEVEELSKKEIYKALRNRIPIEQIKLEERENIVNDYQKIEKKKKEVEMSDEIKRKFREYLIEVAGTRNVLLLDKDLNVLDKFPLKKFEKIEKEECFAIVMDGVINKEIIKMVEGSEINYLIAPSKNIEHDKIKIITIRELE